MASRRNFIGTTLSWSFLATVAGCDGFGGSVRPEAIAWLQNLASITRDLRRKTLPQTLWQEQSQALLSNVALTDVMKTIHYDRLLAKVNWRKHGADCVKAPLPPIEGFDSLGFGHQIFAAAKGRSIVPHGHTNMTSAFLILSGTFRGRQYEKLLDHDAGLIIQPAGDRIHAPGDTSAMSDVRTNVHWFTADSDRAVLFNIHVKNLVAGETGRIYIDPNAGQSLGNGLILAPHISKHEAEARYG